MNRENKQNKKITNLCPNTSIIALSIFGLNIPIIEISRVEKKIPNLYAVYKKLTLYIMVSVESKGI